VLLFIVCGDKKEKEKDFVFFLYIRFKIKSCFRLVLLVFFSLVLVLILGYKLVEISEQSSPVLFRWLLSIFVRLPSGFRLLFYFPGVFF